jgi:hypothetical protein
VLRGSAALCGLVVFVSLAVVALRQALDAMSADPRLTMSPLLTASKLRPELVSSHSTHSRVLPPNATSPSRSASRGVGVLDDGGVDGHVPRTGMMSHASDVDVGAGDGALVAFGSGVVPMSRPSTVSFAPDTGLGLGDGDGDDLFDLPPRKDVQRMVLGSRGSSSRRGRVSGGPSVASVDSVGSEGSAALQTPLRSSLKSGGGPRRGGLKPVQSTDASSVVKATVNDSTGGRGAAGFGGFDSGRRGWPRAVERGAMSPGSGVSPMHSAMSFMGSEDGDGYDGYEGNSTSVTVPDAASYMASAYGVVPAASDDFSHLGTYRLPPPVRPMYYLGPLEVQLPSKTFARK